MSPDIFVSFTITGGSSKGTTAIFLFRQGWHYGNRINLTTADNYEDSRTFEEVINGKINTYKLKADGVTKYDIKRYYIPTDIKIWIIPSKPCKCCGTELQQKPKYLSMEETLPLIKYDFSSKTKSDT